MVNHGVALPPLPAGLWQDRPAMDDRLKATSPGAPAAAGVDGVTLRQLAGPDDYRAGFELQLATWGTGFEGPVPPSVLKIIQRAGGIAAGAFGADGRMLGFLCGLTGVRPPPEMRQARGSRPELFHWSHMLAVAPEARDLGVGTRLKLYQRELLLPLGVETVEWTYDPLEARNAHLNLNRLGAEVVEYVEEMYAGEMGSELARGLGTDRFVVAWRIAGERVRAVLAGYSQPAGAGAPAAPASRAAHPTTAAARFAKAPWVVPVPPGGGEPPLPQAPRVRIEIPERIQDFKAEQPERALAYRLGTRRAFETYLARGYRVAAFCRDADGRCFYGLEAGRP
jgi:chorismate synthase